jgi:molybdate transport system ATP-binding protein
MVAIVSIGQQLVEVVISPEEASSLSIGERVTVSTKAFAPILSNR